MILYSVVKITEHKIGALYRPSKTVDGITLVRKDWFCTYDDIGLIIIKTTKI